MSLTALRFWIAWFTAQGIFVGFTVADLAHRWGWIRG